MCDTSSHTLIITSIVAVFVILFAFVFAYTKRYCHKEVRYVEEQYMFGVRGMMIRIEEGE